MTDTATIDAPAKLAMIPMTPPADHPRTPLVITINDIEHYRRARKFARANGLNGAFYKAWGIYVHMMVSYTDTRVTIDPDSLNSPSFVATSYYRGDDGTEKTFLVAGLIFDASAREWRIHT